MKTLTHRSFVKMLHKPMACFMILCLLNGQFLWALDTTPGNVTGEATFNTAGNTTTATLTAQNAVLNWTNMDTVEGQMLAFEGGLAVLNRVTDAVSFYGDLSAPNMRVYVISPNGVHIGPNSTISAAKFIAAGLNISDENFRAEQDRFVPFLVNNDGQTMEMIGQVQNDGKIIVDNDAYLLGSKVLNTGTIVSENGGLVLMASGDLILIADPDSGINVAIDGSNNPFEINPSLLSAGDSAGDVVNRGTLNNPAGQIVLAAGDTFVQAIDSLNTLSESVELNTYADLAIDVRGDAGSAIQNGNINVANADDPVVDAPSDGSLIALSAIEDVIIEEDSQTIAVNGDNGGATVYLTGDSVKVKESLETGDDLAIHARKSVVVGQAGANPAAVNLTSHGHMAVYAKTEGVVIDGTATSDENMDINARTFVSLGDDVISGGSMDITANTDLVSSGGDFVAQDDLTISGTSLSLWRWGWTVDEAGLGTWDGDQSILSETGTVTVNSSINKIHAGQLFIDGGSDDLAVDLKGSVYVPGNVYISGLGDIRLAERTTISGMGKYYSNAFNTTPTDEFESLDRTYGEGRGGVSIISEAGKIFTARPLGPVAAAADTAIRVEEGGRLINNIRIEGYSDYRNGIGVDLPYGEGEAAIVLMSSETVELGSNANLYARGWYVPEGEGLQGETGVDDRPGVDLLQTDGTVIGGFERNEGDPIDVAIYVASTENDVIVHGTSLNSIVVDNGAGIFTSDARIQSEGAPGNATVVLDAWDTVDFPELEQLLESADEEGLMQFFRQLEGEPAGYRLEVVSRITQWLSEAITNGTLPFADNPALMEALLGNDYVLRGAGAEDNSRAWVLEDPTGDVGVAPLAVLALPELKGCPVEMDAAASELAMNTDDLQLLIGNSLAANPNLQPCKACQKLVTAASILNDADGARMAAMNQIFSTMAPIDAPFTPEISASVATAFANISNNDPEYAQYALANEYINAFVDYVAVLGDDLQAPVGDPVAYTLEKHGEAITAGENPNVAAYIMAQLQASGQSI